MHEWHMQARRERGQEITERFKDQIKRKGADWLVPSSRARKRRYRVKLDPTNVSCSCPDHQETGQRCKHIYAVEHLLRGGDEASTAPAPAPALPNRSKGKKTAVVLGGFAGTGNSFGRPHRTVRLRGHSYHTMVGSAPTQEG